MTIEDEIRRIVREEIARQQPVMPPDFCVGVMEMCPSCGRKDFSTCANTHCYMRPPFVAYQTVPPDMATIKATLYGTGAPYTPPEGKRMGCTCPPGAQTSCPDATCPWKPA